jgi:hypothetical protein
MTGAADPIGEPNALIGLRVVTPDGPGAIVGEHTSRTWVFHRLEVRAYLLVDLDAGGRRLYSPGKVAEEASS